MAQWPQCDCTADAVRWFAPLTMTGLFIADAWKNAPCGTAISVRLQRSVGEIVRSTHDDMVSPGCTWFFMGGNVAVFHDTMYRNE